MSEVKEKKYDLPQRRTKTPEQALAALMRLCSRAERSSGDALRLMKRWGVEGQAERDAVMERLLRDKFIDDRRFAAAYVRDKSSLAGWGAYKIRAGLRAKGISADIVEEALGAIDRQAGQERLMELMVRKARSVKGITEYDRRAKLIRWGLSRGFEYEAVISAANRITGQSGEEIYDESDKY